MSTETNPVVQYRLYLRQNEHKRSIRNADTNNALFIHVSQNNHTIY